MIWNLSADLITAISTAILAVIALGVAILEGRAMRKHNQFSVQPLLNIAIDSRYDDGTTTIGFQLESLGIGPALIKHFVIFFDDKEFVMPETEENLRAQMQLALIPFNLHIKDFGYAPVIAVNKNLIILAMEVNEAETEADVFVKRFGFQIEYQSIYRNETFICSVTNLSGYPKKQNKTNNLFASCYASLREKIKGI